MRKKSYWVATANISNSKMLEKSLFFQRERKREQSQVQRQEEDRERLLMMLSIFKCSRRTAMDY